MAVIKTKIVFDVSPEFRERWLQLCKRENATQAEMFRAMVAKEEGPGMPAASKMIEQFPWETIVHYMDDDIREQVHRELAPCANEDFLARYLELHREKYGEDFAIN